MKNLNYPNIDEIVEYNLIKNSKQEETVILLDAIHGNIVQEFNLYLKEFGSIHKIKESSYGIDDAKALRGCYSSKTKALEVLLAKIIDSQTLYFKHICPYCLIFPRTTYDHYIPEGTYPVYSVLVKNLIPCCITCNGKKLEFWRRNGNRAILHYYNDIIPQTKFLFGHLTFNAKSIPCIKYSLQQPVEVSDQLFALIENHFERLGLIERYNGSIDSVVDEVFGDIQDVRSELADFNSFSKIILRRSNRLKGQYGTNYWKAVALDLLGNSQEFIDSL